ncbi:MAG TPA: sensor domain-containing diguanylate cyclase [Smithella sp.]|nr:sensor domain-containing diguanylate cyclase [Smithella sp.]
MPERIPPIVGANEQSLLAEIDRQNKVIRALMNRVERSTNAQGSDFGLFQTTIMLEDQVHKRTEDLEASLRENEKITRALRESEAKFRGVVSQPLVGIATIEDGKFSYTNPRFAEIFGYGDDEIHKLGPLDVTAEQDRTLVAEQLRRRLSGEVERVDYVFHGLRKDGVIVDIEIHGSAMNIGGKLTLITIIMDISERMRIEREVRALQDLLREQSIRDSLTGLYNRRYMEETMNREMVLAQRYMRFISVAMGDLDHFKDINDRYGHLAGDEILRVFGELMKRYSRGSDICCRYGGEEFLLVMPGMAVEHACERAEQLRAEIEATQVKFGSSAIAVTASFGVASFPQDGRSSDELIAAADRALYAAKKAGRNQVKISSGQNNP